MSGHRDAWINEYKIYPPVGRVFGHGSKPHIVEISAKGERRSFTLSEHLGQTTAEAHAKAKAELDAWLAAHPK